MFAVRAHAADWPMWRCDAARSAATTEQLPDGMQRLWTRELPPLQPAWPDEPRMRFDVAYEPVVVGNTLYAASPRADKMMALDTGTGATKWEFFAGGPVRFAPVVWQDRLFFGCDDGHLYCLSAADGRLLWKFRGGPSDRRVLGNARLTCTWPVRGAPVVADDTVYFAAGIWPFMGIFIYALDAATGDVVWVNDGQGAQFMDHPHGGARAFASVAPQGYMVVSRDKLLIANGRATPAAFDRRTGKMLYFHLAENNKTGDFAASATELLFFNSGRAYLTETGTPPASLGPQPVHTAAAVYTVTDGAIAAHDPTTPGLEDATDSKGNPIKKLVVPSLWKSKVAVDRIHAVAGDALLCSAGKTISLVRLRDAEPWAEETWREELPDEAASVAVADGKLFVSTLNGRLVCYGPPGAPPQLPNMGQAPPMAQADAWTARAADILRLTGITEGYCLCRGIENGRLIEELARQSKLHVIGIDSDETMIDRLRRQFDAAGLYGERVALIVAEPSEAALPPYVAAVTVSETASAGGSADADASALRSLFEPIRPYGGVACLSLSAQQHARLAAVATEAQLTGAEIERSGDWTLFKRVGPLPGSGSWTHQYGDAANTVVSPDSAVRAPLGLLWFGGSSNVDILPRHGHGPPEQVIGGRLFIEGPNSLRAQDVYTGRVIWQRDLPGFGKAYDNTSHQPGANSLGSNYSSAPDGIYVVYEGRCLRLDPASGETVSEFTLPPAAGEDKPRGWGFVSVYDDLLIAGASPMIFDGEKPIGTLDNWDATCSGSIVVLDRHSGEVLWSRDSELAFRHNAICVGGDRLFCIDRLPDAIVEKMARRGEQPKTPARLSALDARSGQLLWSTTDNVFGTWLSCSVRHGLLLQAGRPSRDMLSGEPGDRMTAYHVADGTVAWDRAQKYGGPPLLHGDTIITQEQAFSLLDGEPKSRPHPLTGVPVPWRWERAYGCNTAIASEALMTFRSGAAGFYDLIGDAGTANIGGFKSGCTSNLVVADGVLNAPDYTRTCICSYQNQTSLALVHDPEVELWTFTSLRVGDGRIKRLGINLGAPGDRMADDGTLWLEWPITGGPSPDITVETAPEKPDWFRKHVSRISGDTHPWVGASGAEGVREFTVRLAADDAPPAPYTVKLYFAEPRALKPGQRVFDVAVQGQSVLESFDIVREAGASDRVISRLVRNVSVGGELSIRLAPAGGSRPPVLCGVEVVIEDSGTR